MTSFLVIGDPHFKISNVKETDAMVLAIKNNALRLKPDIIVVLGDVLDRHETIHVSPLTRAVSFLNKMRKIAPTYVLIGNHDLKNNRQYLSDEHPFNALKEWSNDDKKKKITVVDTTTSLTLNDKLYVFVPYVPPGKFQEALDLVPEWKNATCIFAHQEFSGCKMGAIISVEGDVWPLNYPQIVSGHIHDYQEPQTNIIYTGTPIQHAFGDRHDKTISYFIFNDNTNERFLHDRIDLLLPKKQIVYLKCSEVTNYVPQINCELKITIKGTSGELKAIIKHPNIDVWKKQGHKIVYKDVPSENMVETTNNTYKTSQRFSSILYNSLTSDLQTMYISIFGRPIIDTLYFNIHETK